MCGHFTPLTDFNDLLKRLVGQPCADGFTAPETVSPTLGAPIIIQNPESGSYERLPARFGLVPSWYRGSLKDWKASTFNARLENLAEKPVFKGSWRYRHALVPAECFFEWSGSKADRQKWRVKRADNLPLVFAGLWEESYLSEGELWSFALLTRTAGSDMAAIHDREPIALNPDQCEPWLRRQKVDLTVRVPFQLRLESPPLATEISLFE